MWSLIPVFRSDYPRTQADPTRIARAKRRYDAAVRGDRPIEAAAALADLVELEPSDPEWPRKRGDVLRRLGRKDEAMLCYGLAVQRYSEKGFEARARDVAGFASKLDPARAERLIRIGIGRTAPLAAVPIHVIDDEEPPLEDGDILEIFPIEPVQVRVGRS